LEKRQHLDDTTCLLCTDRESIHHLFLECVVARRAWELVSQAIGVQTGSDFESIAKLWLCNKKLVLSILSLQLSFAGVSGN
jgi:predicted GNAT superfamily acetyltransferase